MSTLYRCGTCKRLGQHRDPHSREVSAPVRVIGFPRWQDEETYCSTECAAKGLTNLLSNAGTTPGGDAVPHDAP